MQACGYIIEQRPIENKEKNYVAGSDKNNVPEYAFESFPIIKISTSSNKLVLLPFKIILLMLISSSCMLSIKEENPIKYNLTIYRERGSTRVKDMVQILNILLHSQVEAKD